MNHTVRVSRSLETCKFETRSGVDQKSRNSGKRCRRAMTKSTRSRIDKLPGDIRRSERQFRVHGEKPSKSVDNREPDPVLSTTTFYVYSAVTRFFEEIQGCKVLPIPPDVIGQEPTLYSRHSGIVGKGGTCELIELLAPPCRQEFQIVGNVNIACKKNQSADLMFPYELNQAPASPCETRPLINLSKPAKTW